MHVNHAGRTNLGKLTPPPKAALEFEPARILHLAVLPHECLPAVLEL
jgi:hypothetical protein